LTDRTGLRRHITSLQRLDIDTMVGLNVTALFVASKAAVRKMLENSDRQERGGAIVNIARF
jgi:short-subunit dehydrogenase